MREAFQALPSDGERSVWLGNYAESFALNAVQGELHRVPRFLRDFAYC